MSQAPSQRAHERDQPQDNASGEVLAAAGATGDASSTFVPPHPGAKQMPPWGAAALIEAPRWSWSKWFSLLGPGIVAGGAAIGGGEWLVGPEVTAKYGGALLWVATLSIIFQVVYNIEISRYTLYSGEPIFTGKFRTLPGPGFWLAVYLVLDFGMVFPYLAANAATPLGAVVLGRMPAPDTIAGDKTVLRVLSYCIFVGAFLPLIVGGKVYNSIKALMFFKIVVVLGFLLFVALLYSSFGTWREIGSGFLKIGNLPVQADEDANGNGRLDSGEDWDSDGHLDVIEPAIAPSIDADGDGRPEAWETDASGRPIKFHDIDGDGFRDGANVRNAFASLIRGEGLPDIDFTLMAAIAALVAIAGAGGLSNTPISNYTRDQGWGMGHHVGAIPSVIGGRKIALSHVGCVFQVTAESLGRWRRWYRHVARDQLAVWLPACFVGLALPSMLSVEFLRRGTEANSWTAAGMTAGKVSEHVAHPDVFLGGPTTAQVFWYMTLFCGFLVLAPSMASTADGVVRRWVDVFWTASPRLRALDTRAIKKVYFWVLAAYGGFGLVMLSIAEPKGLITAATMILNYALGFSCWHTLAVNLVLLPPALRPNWFVRIMLVTGGIFFTLMSILATWQWLVKLQAG